MLQIACQEIQELYLNVQDIRELLSWALYVTVLTELRAIAERYYLK
jgi:hypothetical protein